MSITRFRRLALAAQRPLPTVLLCFSAAAVANVAVPFLHPLVHGLEAFAAAFSVLLVGRLSAKLERREEELVEMHARAARTERMAALTALAAGAAHELGTPLGTIALAARELELAGTRHQLPGVVEDARLVRSEVDRCVTIVEQVGAVKGERPSTVTIADLVDDVASRLPAAARSRLVVNWETETKDLVAPRHVLSQALAALLKNAHEASTESSTPIVLGVGRVPGNVQFAVRDDGRGMDAYMLAHAGEPFFTTKPVGEGRGLGLFLARQVAEGLGGRFWLDSAPGQGTRVMLDLPQPQGAS